MELTHLGHSCLLVEVADQRVLIDPGTFSDLDERDLSAVLITHQHPDHADPDRLPGLLRQNPAAQVWAEPQAAAALAEPLGDQAGRVQPLDSGATLRLGPLEVTAVGERHALIHDHVPRIDNRGLVLRAEGVPTVFHPGDALDADPGEVDLLCVPVNAPWAAVRDTIGFVRRVAPRQAIIPIHDGLLNDTGRSMYLGHVATHGAEGGVAVLDLRGAGPTRR